MESETQRQVRLQKEKSEKISAEIARINDKIKEIEEQGKKERRREELFEIAKFNRVIQEGQKRLDEIRYALRKEGEIYNAN